MFRILSLASARLLILALLCSSLILNQPTLIVPEQPQSSSGEPSVPATCERLVRIPVEELQQRGE